MLLLLWIIELMIKYGFEFESLGEDDEFGSLLGLRFLM